MQYGIDHVGIISAFAKTDVGQSQYTLGSYENSDAMITAPLRMVKGHLPEKSGEIAMPEFMMQRLFGDADVGDTVSLKITDLDGNSENVDYVLSGIINNRLTRDDMEYRCYPDLSVEDWPLERPTPSIYVFKDDTAGYKKYYNYFTCMDERVYFDEAKSKELSEFYDVIGSKATAENTWKTSGSRKWAYSFSSDMKNSDVLKPEMTDNMKIINLITLLILVTATISMFSGVMSIMPQRIESLRTLRTIGMTKRKLLSMFLTEFFTFWLMGNALGILLGCGVHELVIAFQKLLGIAAYRGYTAEYAVNESTCSPFIMPLLLSLVIALVSLIIPIKCIITMKFYKTPSAKKLKRNVKDLRGAFSKITSNRLISVITAAAMIVAVFSTAFAYCYYTSSGKGKTYLALGMKNVSEQYYKVDDIDLKENNFDCAVTASIPGATFAGTLSVYDEDNGVTSAQLSSLEEQAETIAWGNYPPDVVCYKADEQFPSMLNDKKGVPYTGEEHYDELDAYNFFGINLVLLNENAMELCGANKDDIVMVSKNYNFPYKTGDEVPLYTSLCDNFGKVRIDTMKLFSAKITKQVSVNDLDENSIITNAFRSDYCIAMTAEKAEALGFYHPNYSSVFMRFGGKMSDKQIRKAVAENVKNTQIFTIGQLKHNAFLNTISSNANVVVLFILLFVLCIISVWNLLQMNIRNNMDKFITMHSIGLSFDKIKKMFVGKMIRITVISLIIGVIVSFAGQGFMKSRFNKYDTLFREYQVMKENYDFPRIITGLNENLEPGDQFYEMTNEMLELDKKYMLKKEMWVPNLIPPLAAVCSVILLSTWLFSLSAAKKIKKERMNEIDKSE